MVVVTGAPATVSEAGSYSNRVSWTSPSSKTQVAVISRRPQGYFLTHIEGDGKNDNFPIVNNVPIGPQAYAIKNGDIIELAGIKMEFNLVK